MNPEIAQYEALAKEILRRCMAEEDAAELHRWLADTLTRIGGGDENAAMTWLQSFDLVDQMMEQYEAIANTPEKDRKVLTWPWSSWNKLIDPLEDGMLGVITAPDGQGKTIYAESIAEHWASHKSRVVFVHYELNRKLMMLRRTARYTGITSRELKSGRLTDEQKRLVKGTRPRLMQWDGYITYLHTPGWTMERTIAELGRLRAEGECDVVVLDYLEKVAASRRQLQMFGSNIYQREADNVEQLKNFSESSGVPVLEVAQMSKAGKNTGIDSVDRTGMRGAGEKSDKANLVVILKRERVGDGYSNEVNVLVDKNTMGATGSFKQIMQPEFYRVGDPVTPDSSPAQSPARTYRKPTAEPEREGERE
jgi:replicative DNA helicase